MDLIKIIANNVRIQRQKLGWSQEKLAEKSGISQRYISKIENDGVDVGATTIEKLSHALGTTPAQIVSVGEVRVTGEDAIHDVDAAIDALKSFRKKIVIDKKLTIKPVAKK